MNPDQIEAVRQAIRLPASALYIAVKLRMPMEAVYQALVWLEGRGEACVRLHHGPRPGQAIIAEWVQA